MPRFEAGGAAHGMVFIQYLAKLKRHFPPAERHQLGAAGGVIRIERGLV